jgi:hypothetical protein
MFGVSAKVLHRYLYHRCSYFSVIAMIGDVALKIRPTNKRHLQHLEFRQRYFTDIGSIAVVNLASLQ